MQCIICMVTDDINAHHPMTNGSIHQSHCLPYKLFLLHLHSKFVTIKSHPVHTMNQEISVYFRDFIRSKQTTPVHSVLEILRDDN